MKGWKNYLLWEGMPFLIVIAAFGLLSIFNWSYESKLVTVREADTFANSHMGPIMLAICLTQTSIAAFILFLLRLLWARLVDSYWLKTLIGLGIILTVFMFLAPAFFIVLLGPAGITMMDQMKQSSAN